MLGGGDVVVVVLVVLACSPVERAGGGVWIYLLHGYTLR